MQRTARFYARLIFYLAGVLIVAALLRLRTDRITGTDTPFLTSEFALLVGAAVILAGVGIVAAHQTRLYALAQRKLSVRLLIMVGTLIGTLGGAALMSRLSFIQPYLFPFVFWLLLVNLALLIMLFTPSAATSDRLAQAAPRILTMLVLSVVLPLIILEFGLRFWFSSFGSEVDRIAYVYSAEEIAAKAFRFRGVPYINYGLSPTYPGHNSLGYRGPEITTPKPEGVFRIATLGGSTTYGELLDNWEDTYPAQLQQMLRDEFGYENIEVINAGVPSYNTWDSLVNFEFRILDLQPDLIIVYHAINDLAARSMPPENYHGIPGNAGIWQGDSFDPGWSALYRYLAINLGRMPNPNDMRSLLRPYEKSAEECCLQMSDEETAAHFAANPPIYFERNLRNLIAVAQANNVQVLLSSWAYFPDETVNNMNSMTRSYRQEAIAEHNAVIQRLTEETGAYFYDLAGSLPYNPDFWFADGVHLTASGTHEQAGEYAAFLNAEQLIPN
jgi:lysophospholipase L1-like esterase